MSFGICSRGKNNFIKPVKNKEDITNINDLYKVLKDEKKQTEQTGEKIYIPPLFSVFNLKNINEETSLLVFYTEHPIKSIELCLECLKADIEVIDKTYGKTIKKISIEKEGLQNIKIEHFSSSDKGFIEIKTFLPEYLNFYSAKIFF